MLNKGKKNMARGKTILEVNISDVEKRRHPSKHYVYIITVSWSDGSVNVIYRRYSKFFDFQVKLLENFPQEAGKNNPNDRIIPFLPGKIIFGRSHIREVALRRLELINKYCKQLIKLPAKIVENELIRKFFEPTIEDLIPPKSRSGNQSQVKASSISEPVLLDQYTVVADYTKEGGNEISLHEGESVDVVEKNETGWWFVSGEEGQGWVPSSYLEMPDGLEESMTMDEDSPADKDRPHLATRLYTPQFPDELALEKGAVVEVIQKKLDGWWKVRSKGKEGLVPGSYLTRTDTLRGKRIREALNKTPGMSAGGAINQTQGLGGSHNENHGWSESSSDEDFEEVGGAPGMPVVGDQKKVPRGKELLKNNPLLAIPFARKDQSARSQPKLPAHMSKNRRQGRPTANAVAPPGVEESPPVYRKPPPPRRQSVKTLQRKTSLFPPEDQEEPIYLTVADFDNHAGDGISFRDGSKVQVLDKHTSGWWYVTIGDQTGWAPSQYIEKKSQPRSKSPGRRDEPVVPKNKQTSFSNSRDQAVTSHKNANSSKPLPALPSTSRSQPKYDTSDDDFEEEPFYANEDTKTSMPPPLPAKNPTSIQNYKAEETTQSNLKATNRNPVTSPKAQKKVTDFTSELASKFGGLKASNGTPPQQSGAKPTTAKPQLPKKKKVPTATLR